MAFGLCQYKDIFGKPCTGAHSYRILNIAIIDVIFTIIFAWLIAKWMNWNFWKTLLGLFLLGIIMHRLFCVRTTIDKIIFPHAS
jgi:hypothetical protein